MPSFEVSQGELWHRVYRIEAETLDEAKAKYKKHALTGDLDGEDVWAKDPEYVEDILDDQLWTEL